MSDKTDKWLRLADRDITTAKVNLKGKQYLWVGFLCHLIVEKSLKAVIADKTNEMPPRIHNLVKLAQLAGLYDDLTETEQELLDVLIPMQIEARYKEYKDTIRKSLTPQGWKALLTRTEEFYV